MPVLRKQFGPKAEKQVPRRITQMGAIPLVVALRAAATMKLTVATRGRAETTSRFPDARTQPR